MKTRLSFLLLIGFTSAIAIGAEETAAERSPFFDRFFRQGPTQHAVPSTSQPAGQRDLGPAPGTRFTGEFRVAAVGGQRIVLRPTAGTGPRVVADVPPSETVPKEGAKVVLTEASGFVVTRVQSAADGSLNIFVGREPAR